MEDIQLLMLQMQTCLHQLQSQLDPREYDSLRKAMDGLRERLEFSTPFGRSDQPVVLDMEQQLYQRTAKLYSRMQAFVEKNGRQEDVRELVSEVMAMSELLKSREKLRIG